MRKVISLGVLALLLSVLASPVSAGSKETCKDLKGASKGLYGLCVAYQNAADGISKERIMGNFNRRALDGEVMPPNDSKKPDIVECPCWSNEDLVRATCDETFEDYWFSNNGIT